MLGRLLLGLNVMACVASIGLAAKFVFLPIIAEKIYKEQYKLLLFQCDNLMQNHLLAKNRVRTEGSDQAEKALHAAEVGLVGCNDYDKLRKQLLRFGLTDNDLSAFGIEAIEEKANDVQVFVKTHELKY